MAGLLLLACAPVRGNDADQQPHASFNKALFSLLKSEMAEQNNANVVISPLSLGRALHAIQEGAGGETLKQITDVLGSPESVAHMAGQYADDSRLKAAAVMLVDQKLTLKDSYKSKFPGMDVRNVSFQEDPAKQEAEVNAWVNKRTKGRVPQILPLNSLRPDTALVYVNALTFDARWQDEFAKDQTRTGKFTNADGTVSKCSFMNALIMKLHVLINDDCTIAIFPYKQPEGQAEANDFHFIALMPEAKTKLADFVAMQDWDTVHVLVREALGKDKEYVGVHLPKFKAVSPILRVSKPFSEMGMKDMFINRKADFSNMCDQPGIFVNEIYHRCSVVVNEAGTQAGAATSFDDPFGGSEKTLSFDRPFLWLIYDAGKDIVLFSGCLTDLKQAGQTRR